MHYFFLRAVLVTAASCFALLSIATTSQAVDFTFTRIVDENDPLPLSTGGVGGEFRFGRPPALSGNRVAFYAHDMVGNQGVYSATIGGAVTAIVDEFTQVPGQAVGSFFDNWDNRVVDISGSEIVFAANSSSVQPHRALYKTDLVGNVSIVADLNTPVPGRPFTQFLGFDNAPSIVDGVIAVRASVWDGVTFGGMGVYQHENGVLSELTFQGAGFVSSSVSYHPSTDGTSFAYVYTSRTGAFPHRLVRRDGAVETTIVSALDPIPDGDGVFNGSFRSSTSDFVIDGDNIFIRDRIFMSPTGSDYGVFLHDGNTLQVIAREGDPIPGSTETFGVIHNYVSMEGGHYAFAATTGTGIGHSLYSNLDPDQAKAKP